jgi:hypothetical protein
MKPKLINRPTRQNRGMNIPLGGYLCGSVFDVFFSVASFSIWSSTSSGIATPISASILPGKLSSLAGIVTPVMEIKGKYCFNSFRIVLISPEGLVFITTGIVTEIGIFILHINYRIFILLFAQIHNNIIYVKKLTTRFNFTNRRSCHA